MLSLLSPFVDLINGDAYRPHPADAALSLGRRFLGKTIVVIGGGGTGSGWTQRITFGRDSLPVVQGRRSQPIRRGTPEWGAHLLAEARATSGWALLLVEQQWQAAVSNCSAASVGGTGVEQMLRVRDAIREFGDERMSEDAIRSAIDHPTMDGAVVVGARGVVIEPLEKEARANGFEIAAIRIGVVALLERHLGELQKKRQSPTRTLVAYDGQSALIVGIRDGAFDGTEGGLSYLVNRVPADVRSQIVKRISSPASLRDWNGRVEILGAALQIEPSQVSDGLDLHQEAADVVVASVDDSVRHDLRSGLQETRGALRSWVRVAFIGALALTVFAIVGLSVQAAEGLRLQDCIRVKQSECIAHAAAEANAQLRNGQLRKEAERAKQIADWVDRNYHAQALVHGFLVSIPVEVSVDALSVQASEGLPQAKLRFTLLGSEDAQRAALRAIEDRLYRLGYEIGRRDDPTPATARRGGVVYAWDLILPSFGS